MNKLWINLALVAVLMSAQSLYSALIEVETSDEFTQLLEDQKRLALVVVDYGKLEGDDHQALEDLRKELDQLSEQELYKLSKIGFALVDIEKLPADKRTELETLMEGELEEPATLVLFENGKILMDDGEPLTEDDLLDDGYDDEQDDDLDDINAILYEAWEIPIKYQLRKRELADNGRTQDEKKKELLQELREEIAEQAEDVQQKTTPQQQVIRVYRQQPVYVRYPYYGGFSYPGYPRWRRRYVGRGPWRGGSWRYRPRTRGRWRGTRSVDVMSRGPIVIGRGRGVGQPRGQVGLPGPQRGPGIRGPRQQ